jgi:hypothetical protein
MAALPRMACIHAISNKSREYVPPRRSLIVWGCSIALFLQESELLVQDVEEVSAQ